MRSLPGRECAWYAVLRQCAAPLDRSKDQRFAGPEAYTPKHLAERINCSKTAFEGERKQITVLFADLKASMELLADRDPGGGPPDPRSGARAQDGSRPSL
jgi:hypothetical protein